MLVYQLNIRMYDIFPKKHGPMGLGLFCFSLIVNLMSIFALTINIGMIEKKYEALLNLIAIIIGIFAIIGTTFFYIKKDIMSLLQKEKQRGDKFNRGWMLFTWIYILLTIAMAIFILK